MLVYMYIKIILDYCSIYICVSKWKMHLEKQRNKTVKLMNEAFAIALMFLIVVKSFGIAECYPMLYFGAFASHQLLLRTETRCSMKTWKFCGNKVTSKALTFFSL